MDFSDNSNSYTAITIFDIMYLLILLITQIVIEFNCASVSKQIGNFILKVNLRFIDFFYGIYIYTHICVYITYGIYIKPNL